MDQSLTPKIVFILGGPGAGKGTQCDIMKQKHDFQHFSTGDLLRDFIKTECEEAAHIRTLLSQGKLAPSTMLVQIVKNNIFKDGPNNRIYLIDGIIILYLGFPRSA